MAVHGECAGHNPHDCCPLSIYSEQVFETSTHSTPLLRSQTATSNHTNFGLTTCRHPRSGTNNGAAIFSAHTQRPD